MGLEVRTAKQIAADAKAREDEARRTEARAFLASTDWMVVRLAETGTPIPAEIAEKRAQARIDAG